MSHRLRDSFDSYGVPSEAVGVWTSFGVAKLGPASLTRFGVGQCVYNLAVLNNIGLQATWSATTNTVFIVFSHMQVANTGSSGAAQEFRFYDGASFQFSIRFLENGSISFYRGNAGTLLGTYNAAFGGNGVWNHFQIKVVIDGTNGEVHVRKNGNTSDDFTLTGQNTQNTANAYITGMDVICRGSATNIQYWDDFWLYDDQNAGDGAPFDWIGDVRAVLLYPRSDFITNLTRNGTNSYQGGMDSSGTQGLANGVQRAVLPFIVQNSGTIQSLNVTFNAAAAGSVRFGIYDATGARGGPGSLITNGTANVLAAPALGVNNVTFPTPPSVTVGTNYWVVALSNGTMTLKATNLSTLQVYTQSTSYAGGLASPMTLTSASGSYGAIELVIAPTATANYTSQNATQNDPNEYNYNATVNNYDLYGTTDFASYSPSAIFGVTVRCQGYKSDAGARSAKARLRSNVTVVDGSALALPTTLPTAFWLDQFTDPNTGGQWSTSGVAAAYFGPLISA